MPNKKLKKKIKKTAKNKIDNLIDLAHQGTADSIEQLSALAQMTKNKEEKIMAKIAKDEARVIYYEPKNKAEENDFILAWLIWKKQNKIESQQMELSRLKSRLNALQVEDAVHQKVMKSDDTNGDWQYYSGHYFEFPETENKMAEIKNDIKYNESWIKEAEKMIKNDKYRQIPADFFYSYHWDWEDAGDDFDDMDEELEF